MEVSVGNGEALEVLARIERKGIPLRGLEREADFTRIAFDSTPLAQAFATSLRDKFASFSISIDTLQPSFTLSETSACTGRSTAPVSTRGVALDSIALTANSRASDETSAAETHIEDPETSRKLVALLDARRATYDCCTHSPVRTSEEAAQIRGAPLASGAKAMLLCVKPGDTFVLCVISASQKMDSKLMKKAASLLLSTWHSYIVFALT